MRDFIERMQAKPEHVRKRFAFLTSAGITVVVALGWLAAIASSNSFALSPSDVSLSSIDESGGLSEIVEDTSSGFSDLLGAAGGATGNNGQVGGGLQVIDGESSSSLDRESDREERTVIPF
jgi:hypothetical protein